MGEPGLLYHLPFRQSSQDYSGYNNHLVRTGTYPYSGNRWAAGPKTASKALEHFTNGSGTTLTLPYHPLLNTTTSTYSCLFWFRYLNWNSAYFRVIDKDFYNGFAVTRKAGNSYLTWSHKGNEFDTGTTSMSTNTWYHMAMCKDGANMTWYRNGRVDSTTAGGPTSSIATGSGAIHLMSEFGGDNNGVWCMISDFRFYIGRCLTQQDVIKIYNGINSYRIQGG